MNPLSEISRVIREILEIIDFEGDKDELTKKIESNIFNYGLLKILKTLPAAIQTELLGQLKSGEITWEDCLKRLSGLVDETIIKNALSNAAKDQLKSFIENILPQIPTDQQLKIKAVLDLNSEKLAKEV